MLGNIKGLDAVVEVGNRLAESLDRHSKALHANAEANTRLAASMDEAGLRSRR